MNYKVLLRAATAATIALATSAQAATVYTGNRTVGGASAQLSITTDDTIGVLSSTNIIDWTIVLNEGGNTFTLRGAGPSRNSALQIAGSALSATATDLIFNFSASGLAYALFQSPGIGSGQTFYCVQTNSCFDSSGSAEALEAGLTFSPTRAVRTGQVVIASTGAVPEPSTWAMLIIGFGATGAAMRRRRQVNTALRFA